MQFSYVSVLWMLAGVALYAALSHFVTGLRRTYDTLHIKSAALAFCAAIALLLATQMATTHSLQSYQLGVQVSAISVALAYINMIWFVREYTSDRSLWPPIAATVPFVLAPIIVPIARSLSASGFQPYLRYADLPWGETITTMVSYPTPWMNLLWLGHILFATYVVTRCVSLFRNGPAVRAWGLTASITPFIIALLLKFSLNNEVVNLPGFVSSFGLLAMIVLMGVTLSNENRLLYAQMHAVLNNVPVVIDLKRLDGRYIFVNRAFERLNGLVATQVLDKTDHDVLSPERTQRLQSMDASVASGKIVESEESFTVDNESRTYAQVRFPLLDGTGKCYAICGISSDITERKAAAEELRHLAATLERRVAVRTKDLARVNKELEAFCYSVSHDLRAPLMSVNGFADLLVRDHATALDQDAHKYLQRIRDGAKRMGQLIEDLLSLSRVTREDIHRESCNVSEVADEVIKQLREADSTRQVSVHVEKDLNASADKRLLAVVMRNLLENAWKYTSKTTAATISVTKVATSPTTYCVRDNGAGFDPVLAEERLFQPFKRLHADRDFPGTGVGLATVARIVHRHGGRIWAEGKVNEGAAFFFTLPTLEEDTGQHHPINAQAQTAAAE
jgi:PAS domain S-box-containing protein